MYRKITAIALTLLLLLSLCACGGSGKKYYGEYNTVAEGKLTVATSPDFAPYEGQCRFSPCYHLSEPDCAVLEAMREGKLGAQRVERYHILLKRVQEIWRKRYD